MLRATRSAGRQLSAHTLGSTVYFWRISDLKADLASSNLTERDRFSYFLASTVVYSLAASIPLWPYNFWDHLASAILLLIAVLGSIYIYYSNGGSSGFAFLERAISLGFVFGIRFVVFFVPVAAVFTAIYDLTIGLPEDMSTTPLDVIFIGLFMVFFYWRLGAHICEVADRARAA